jgi:uncharacterized protein YbjQ (UPF0145 family)
MDLPKKFARRGIVFYLQVAAAVVSILLGLAQMTKESQPLVQKIQENRQQSLLRQQQEEVVRKADAIAGMGISWQYRGNDGTWRYYSDDLGRYWCRVNIQGTHEYSESPQYLAASSHSRVR